MQSPGRLALLCRSLVAELGVDLEAGGTALIDHTDFVKSKRGGHSVTASSNLINSTAILGGCCGNVGTLLSGACPPIVHPAMPETASCMPQAPVLFKGLAATISLESTTVRSLKACVAVITGLVAHAHALTHAAGRETVCQLRKWWN
jgi:hypothetical protein